MINAMKKLAATGGIVGRMGAGIGAVLMTRRGPHCRLDRRDLPYITPLLHRQRHGRSEQCSLSAFGLG